MSINTSVELSGKSLIINGDLLFSTVSTLLDKSIFIIENHQSTSLIIDCSSVSYVDSAGIALLIEWKRLCHHLNKTCFFKGIPSQAIALITTYKLQHELLD